MDINRQNEYGIQQKSGKIKFRSSLLLLLLVFSIFIIGSQIATQVIAHQLNYHPDLGSGKFYPPWSWASWYSQYGNVYSEIFRRSIALGVSFSACSIGILALVITLRRSKGMKHKNLHGSSRWAKKKEIVDAGLLPRPREIFRKAEPSDGVYVGGWENPSTKELTYLRHNGPEHILTFAPTRSGKGVGLVLPTALSWKESAIFLDIKGEIWALTSGWRQRYAKNKCLRFDPSSSDPNKTIRYNPISEVRFGTDDEVGDAQNLALMIADSAGKGIDDSDHWTKTSYALLTALIIYCGIKERQTGGEGSLPKINHMISNPGQSLEELWEEMQSFPNSIVSASGADMLNTPEKERGSIVSTAKSHLSLYRDPVVAKNVSTSDFRISDLQNAENPVSLYLVINPSDKGRLLPLLRILITQTVRVLTYKMEFKDGRSVKGYKHRLLALLDEFPSLGRMPIVEEALSFCASYGIKFYLIVQDLAQIFKIYTKEESVTSNCHIKNAYAPNKPETKEYLSKACGDTTVLKESVTVSGQRASMFYKNASRSLQEIKRPLLTPDECGRLPGAIKDRAGNITSAGDMLVFAAGFPAIYGKQILYFNDPIFSLRSKVSPPEVTDRLINSIAVEEEADFDMDKEKGIEQENEITEGKEEESEVVKVQETSKENKEEEGLSF